jgi:transcription antitermination factor NusG
MPNSTIVFEVASEFAPASSMRIPQDSEPREVGNLAWYAIYTRSRYEKVVQDSLRGKGYDSFSPFFKVRRRRGNRNVEVDLPLFSSYVFCRFDALKKLPILKTPGVVFILSRAGEPEPVDLGEITSLQTMMRSGRALQPWDFVRAGQKVRICAGSLAGAEGTLVRVKNRDRLVATVTVLQRAVAVEIDQDMVEPIY